VLAGAAACGPGNNTQPPEDDAMATLNATTWTQAKSYVASFIRTGDISGSGNSPIAVPKNADQFVPLAEKLFQQVTQKHGGDGGAYHNHTGTAGALIALIDKVRTDGDAGLAKQIAQQIWNNGQGVGYIMTSTGRVDFRGTSGCTRSDLSSYVNGRGVFQGVWAGRQ
jgi:hypothetical protein